jgi:hypothetical protein
MPAGFGRIHHCANLARNGWPGPHLRTGDVTLIFTTDETCSNVLTAAMGAAVATNSAPVLGEPLSRGTIDRSVHRDVLLQLHGIRGYASQPQQPQKRRLSGAQRRCRVR